MIYYNKIKYRTKKVYFQRFILKATTQTLNTNFYNTFAVTPFLYYLTRVDHKNRGQHMSSNVSMIVVHLPRIAWVSFPSSASNFPLTLPLLNFGLSFQAQNQVMNGCLRSNEILQYNRTNNHGSMQRQTFLYAIGLQATSSQNVIFYTNFQAQSYSNKQQYKID